MRTDIPAIMGVFPPNVLPEEIEMDLVPGVPDSLYQAAQEDRGHFGRELDRYMECTPEAKLKLPFVLAKALGPVLGAYNLALLWGLIWSAPARLKEAIARAGYPKLGLTPKEHFSMISNTFFQIEHKRPIREKR